MEFSVADGRTRGISCNISAMSSSLDNRMRKGGYFGQVCVGTPQYKTNSKQTYNKNSHAIRRSEAFLKLYHQLATHTVKRGTATLTGNLRTECAGCTGRSRQTHETMGPTMPRGDTSRYKQRCLFTNPTHNRGLAHSFSQALQLSNTSVRHGVEAGGLLGHGAVSLPVNPPYFLSPKGVRAGMPHFLCSLPECAYT